MQIKKLIAALFVMVIGFSACQKDIIVKDITDKNVTALSPPDGYNTPNNSITFWWEKVDGAEKYNVQIVSPSFSNIQQLITDTTVTTDKFTKVLLPGTYQWRVRATNNGGETPWTTRTLTIDTSSNLAYSSVILYSPADSFYTNASSLTLSWSPVSNATTYKLILPSVLTGPTYFSTTSAVVNFTSEGTFTWSVQAENSFSFSPATSRKIFIDRSAPSSSITLSYPLTTVATSVDSSFKWVALSDAYKDVIEISTDGFNNSINRDTVMTKDSQNNRTYPITSSIFTPTVGPTYSWRIKSIDRAGNVGTPCTAKTFSVQ